MDTIYRGNAIKLDADVTVKGLTADTTVLGAATLTTLAVGAITSTGAMILPSVTLKTGTAPTIAAGDVVCLFKDATQAVVLPAIATSAGRILMLKAGTGSVTVTANASELIDNGAGTLLLTPAKGAILYATSSGWFQLADC